MAARNGRGCARGKRSGHKIASKRTRSKAQRKARLITLRHAGRHVRRRFKKKLAMTIANKHIPDDK